jgi:hypothetical protein
MEKDSNRRSFWWKQPAGPGGTLFASRVTATVIRRQIAAPLWSLSAASSSARAALSSRALLAVALEHQVGSAPNVDLGYYAAKLHAHGL